jgi:xanthine dehydrogenase YagR molybdenum-binding subunit
MTDRFPCSRAESELRHPTGTATALPPIHTALRELRKQLGVADTGAVDVTSAVDATGRPSVEVEVTSVGPGQPPEMIDRSRAGLLAIAGPVFPAFTTFSWIAHFAEVQVEATTRPIRVLRVVSVADCGRVATSWRALYLLCSSAKRGPKRL